MYFTYLMASKRNGTLYCGHTGDIWERVELHKLKTFKGFSADHGTDRLVWFEWHETRDAAFSRERQIKKWNRQWKRELIEALNPEWEDLSIGMSEAEAYAPNRKAAPIKKAAPRKED